MSLRRLGAVALVVLWMAFVVVMAKTHFLGAEKFGHGPPTGRDRAGHVTTYDSDRSAADQCGAAWQGC